MRCLALAQGWIADGGTVTFLSRCESREIRRRVTREGARFIPLAAVHPDPSDWASTSRLIRKLNPDWLVIDGYHFDPGYQKAARAASTRVLVIDDMAHWPEYHADILLNQNLDAEKLRYHCDLDTKMLLGTPYVLLRNEFLKWSGWQREVAEIGRKVLVTLGGSDPDNVTLTILKALRRLGMTDLVTRVVIGAANPHAESLRNGVESSEDNFEFLTNAARMPELMAWADVGVASGGSTCWELALMGLPMLVLVLDDNQRCTAEGLEAHGAAISLGPVTAAAKMDVSDVLKNLLVDRERRCSLSRRAQGLVDGRGAPRVSSILRGEEACA